MSANVKQSNDEVAKRPTQVEVSPVVGAELLAWVWSTVLWPDRSHALQQRGNAKTALLHGTIFVTIHEAQSLPGDPTRCSVRGPLPALTVYNHLRVVL